MTTVNILVLSFLAITTNGQAPRQTTSRPAASRPAKPEDKWVAAFTEYRNDYKKEKRKDKWQDTSVYAIEREINRCRQWLSVSKSQYDKAYWNASITWLTDLSKETGRPAKTPNETDIEKQKDKRNTYAVQKYKDDNKQYSRSELFTQSTRREGWSWTPRYLDMNLCMQALQKLDPAYATEIKNYEESIDIRRRNEDALKRSGIPKRPPRN